MRTTLSIDDDLLLKARALAEHQQRTLGEVVSDCLRERFDRPRAFGERREGVLLLPDRPGPKVTLEMVNALRDVDGF